MGSFTNGLHIQMQSLFEKRGALSTSIELLVSITKTGRMQFVCSNVGYSACVESWAASFAAKLMNCQVLSSTFGCCARRIINTIKNIIEGEPTKNLEKRENRRGPSCTQYYGKICHVNLEVKWMCFTPSTITRHHWQPTKFMSPKWYSIQIV